MAVTPQINFSPLTKLKPSTITYISFRDKTPSHKKQHKPRFGLTIL